MGQRRTVATLFVPCKRHALDTAPDPGQPARGDRPGLPRHPDCTAARRWSPSWGARLSIKLETANPGPQLQGPRGTEGHREPARRQRPAGPWLCARRGQPSARPSPGPAARRGLGRHRPWHPASRPRPSLTASARLEARLELVDGDIRDGPAEAGGRAHRAPTTASSWSKTAWTSRPARGAGDHRPGNWQRPGPSFDAVPDRTRRRGAGHRPSGTCLKDPGTGRRGDLRPAGGARPAMTLSWRQRARRHHRPD